MLRGISGPRELGSQVYTGQSVRASASTILQWGEHPQQTYDYTPALPSACTAHTSPPPLVGLTASKAVQQFMVNSLRVQEGTLHFLQFLQSQGKLL